MFLKLVGWGPLFFTMKRKFFKDIGEFIPGKAHVKRRETLDVRVTPLPDVGL